MAGTNLWQVISTEHAVEESSNEGWNRFKLKHELQFLHHLWDWAKSELNDLGSITSSSGVVWSCEIGLKLLDVIGELNWLLHDILGHGSNEIFHGGKAIDISLQTVNILSHALAVSENSWEHSGKSGNIFSNLGRFSSLLIEIKLLNNWDGSASVCGAHLKLCQAVVNFEGVEKSRDELESLLWSWC